MNVLFGQLHYTATAVRSGEREQSRVAVKSKPPAFHPGRFPFLSFPFLSARTVSRLKLSPFKGKPERKKEQRRKDREKGTERYSRVRSNRHSEGISSPRVHRVLKQIRVVKINPLLGP